MEEGGQFGHVGNLCTFEAMRLAFGLDDPGLRALAEIVHAIDLDDGRYARPAAAGVDSVLVGAPARLLIEEGQVLWQCERAARAPFWE